MSKKNDKEKLIFKVAKGSLVPADAYSVEAMRKMGMKIGDSVVVTVTKPRTLEYHKFAHKLGQLIVANINKFNGMSAHDALKKVQIDGEIACKETVADINGIKMKFVQAKSLSFDSMDEIEFKSVMQKFCEHISETYWPDMEPWQIEEMAANFVEPA